MTDRQIEKLSELLGQVGLAALVGGAGDLVINGERGGVDLFGIAVGFVLMAWSVYLTGLLRR
ncbi:MAG: hypothetical protein AAB368_15020 [bacterium]